MNPKHNLLPIKRTTFLLLGLLAFAILAVYYFFDPASISYFPGCPIKEASGFDCPGCGSQRALHALLHFKIAAAFQQNALFVLSIPYIIMCVVVMRIRPASPFSQKWKDRLMGKSSTWIILLIIVLFGVLRNIF